MSDRLVGGGCCVEIETASVDDLYDFEGFGGGMGVEQEHLAGLVSFELVFSIAGSNNQGNIYSHVANLIVAVVTQSFNIQITLF